MVEYVFRRRTGAVVAAGLTAAALMLAATPAARAETPAAGADVAGKTVYVLPLSWLRYGEGLLSKPYTFTRNALEVKGRGKCSAAACPINVGGIDVFARRSRIDLVKPATGTVVSYRTLRRGDEGDDVKAAQNALIKAGSKITADGKYGRGTEAAVRDFQRKNSLGVDGAIGPQTRAKLLG